MLDPLFRLDPFDAIATARFDIEAGASIGEGLSAAQAIPAGHKVAVRVIKQGETVLKGGIAIGAALSDIAAGALVHGHNLGPSAPDRSALHPSAPPNGSGRFLFDGYVRDDGRVATRNVIGIFVVGNCAATVARQTADWFDEERLSAFPHVDGVVAYVHEIGCGMEMTGEPMDLLRRTIAGYVRHPNTAGAVILALGCERNNLKVFLDQQNLLAGDRLHALTMQESGGTRRTVEEARRLVADMLPAANRARRTSVSAAHLTIGLQSSGADGFLGASANPALGVAVDILVGAGGTAILSQTSELSAVGSQLASRAADAATAAQLTDRLRWWTEEYAQGTDTERDGRLNPANAAAGVATVQEKGRDSLAKSGATPIAAVYRYAEEVTAKGLVFMDAPSYDPVAVTGQIAGGAGVIAFATGRGRGFGSYPAPTMSIASSTPAYRRMAADIDLNAGVVIDGDIDVAAMGRRIFDRLLAHASGERTRSEIDGMGENEFVPWPIGVLT